MCTYIAGIVAKTEREGIVVAVGDGISHHHPDLPLTVDDVGRFGIEAVCEWEYYPLTGGWRGALHGDTSRLDEKLVRQIMHEWLLCEWPRVVPRMPQYTLLECLSQDSSEWESVVVAARKLRLPEPEWDRVPPDLRQPFLPNGITIESLDSTAGDQIEDVVAALLRGTLEAYSCTDYWYGYMRVLRLDPLVVVIRIPKGSVINSALPLPHADIHVFVGSELVCHVRATEY